MRKRLKLTTPLILLVMLSAGCAENLLQIDPEISDLFVYKTDQRGRVLNSDEELAMSISCKDPTVSPSFVQVTIEDQNDVLFQQMFPYADFQENKSFWTPEEDRTGFFRITVQVQGASGEIFDEEIIPFYSGIETPRVLGVDAYPSVFYPEGQGILKARFSELTESDLYLKWTLDGASAGEGLVSEGADQLNISAPDLPGVYPLVLEVYPVAPGAEYDFPSPYFWESRVFVSLSPGADEGELSPADAFRGLYLFRGETEEYRTGTVDKRGELLGDVVLGVVDGRFGYMIGEGGGIRIPYAFLPEDSLHVGPGSLVFRGVPSDLENFSGVLFSAHSEDHRRALVVKFDSATAVSVKSVDAEGVVKHLGVLDLPFGADESLFEIGLSFFQYDDRAEVYWFFNGLFAGVVRLDGLLLKDYQGELLLGSFGEERSLPWLWDGFGLFGKPVDDHFQAYRKFFHDVQERGYRNRLVWAEGFDSPRGPGVDVEASEGVSWDQGRMRLQAGESALFPGVTAEDGFVNWIFDLSSDDAALAGSAELEAVYFDSRGKETVLSLGAYDFSRGRWILGEKTVSRPVLNGLWSIAMEKRGDAVFFLERPISGILEKDPLFRIRLDGPDENSEADSLVCRSVTVFREWSELVLAVEN